MANKRGNRVNRGKAPAQRQSSAQQQRPIAQPLPLDIDPRLIQVEETRIESFRGPVPHPDVLLKYDTVQPGLADRIVAMAEREQAHRHGIVDAAVQANIASDRRGQWMAFTLAALFMIVAVLIGVFASAAAGAILGGLDIATIIGLFLKRERDEKRNSEST